MRLFFRKLGQLLMFAGPVLGLWPLFMAIIFSLLPGIPPEYGMIAIFTGMTFPVGLGVGILGFFIFIISSRFPADPEKGDQNLSLGKIVIYTAVLGLLMFSIDFLFSYVRNIYPTCDVRTDKTVYYPGDTITATWGSKHAKSAHIEGPLTTGFAEGEAREVPLEGSATFKVPDDFGWRSEYVGVPNADGSFKLAKTDKMTFDETLEFPDSVRITLMRGEKTNGCSYSVTIKSKR